MRHEGIDQFEVGEILGRGAQGHVYCGYDRVLDRKVVLKVFNPLRSGEVDEVRALREAKSLARLQHPNIGTLYGFTRNDDACILVMEYVEGTPLSDKLKERRLEFAEIEAIMRQLVDALHYAEQRGLCHGDIKPANILIGTDGTARLLDFGLATMDGRNLSLDTLDSGAESQSAFEGTLAYCAPERIMGGPSDVRSDIFSLGAVLYEMIAGRPAFLGPNPGVTINNILSRHCEPLISHRPEVKRSQQSLVDALLEKDPNRRPACMAAVLALLDREADDRTQKLHWFTVALRKLRLRARTAFILGACLILILSILTLNTSMGGAEFIQNALPISAQIERGVDLVVDFHQEGAIAEAQSIFGMIVRDDPDHAAGNAGLALALVREYTKEETDPATLRRATALAENALKRDPHLALSNIAAAWTAEFNGDFDRAKNLYDRADILDPENPLVFEGRARIWAKQQNFTQAEATLRKALRTYPRSRVFIDQLGTTLSNRENYSAAEEVFRYGIRLYPDNIRGYANLSHVLFMQQRTDDAIRTAQSGLQIGPDAALYNNLGTYLFSEGRYEEAASAFERTLELDGNTHEFLFWANLADAYRWLPGRQKEARSAYRQAVRLLRIQQESRPEHVGINSRMALYCAKASDFGCAQSNLVKIDTSELTAPEDLYRLAIIHEIMMDRQESLRILKVATENGYNIHEIENDPELKELRQDKRFNVMFYR